jgi:hypothetical protein
VVDSMTIIYTEVDLYEFDTDDLVEELERREVIISLENKNIIQKMFDDQQLGKDIQPLLNELYFNTIGRLA